MLCMILSNDVLPILINHPNSDLIYTSLNLDFEYFFKLLMLIYYFLITIVFEFSRRIWQIVLAMMLIVIACNTFYGVIIS